jgi:hypothetical protein
MRTVVHDDAGIARLTYEPTQLLTASRPPERWRRLSYSILGVITGGLAFGSLMLVTWGVEWIIDRYGWGAWCLAGAVLGAGYGLLNERLDR